MGIDSDSHPHAVAIDFVARTALSGDRGELAETSSDASKRVRDSVRQTTRA